MKHTYFVSYICNIDGNTSISKCEADVYGKINSEKLETLARKIEKQNKVENVVIINFIKL